MTANIIAFGSKSRRRSRQFLLSAFSRQSETIADWQEREIDALIFVQHLAFIAPGVLAGDGSLDGQQRIEIRLVPLGF